MQRLLLAATILMSTACGHKADDSAAKGFPGFQIQVRPLLDDSLTFERDLRPVDGAKTTIVLTKDERGTYDIKKTSEIVDRNSGENVVSEQSLGSRMSCTQGLTDITCSRDMRPVDGALVTINFFNNGGEYDVSLTSQIVDRQTGEDKSDRKDIASGLRLKPAARPPRSE
jgi:hypothetical protein